jgi:hypothetical protein
MSVIGGASDSAFSQLSEANYSTASKKAQDLVGSSDSQKIERSAKQFESILLASWLQQAEKSFATAPGGRNSSYDRQGSGKSSVFCGSGNRPSRHRENRAKPKAFVAERKNVKNAKVYIPTADIDCRRSTENDHADQY